MGKRYRIFVLALLAIGLVLSILSATSLCNFGGCTEAHQYRLFGLPFPASGIVFFTAAGLLTVLANRFPWAGSVLSLLMAAAAGAEINMILLQKYVTVPAQFSSAKVARIEIKHVGPRAASDDLVRANIRVKPGDPYLRAATLAGCFSLWEEYLEQARTHVAPLGERAIHVQFEQFLTHPEAEFKRLVR